MQTQTFIFQGDQGDVEAKWCLPEHFSEENTVHRAVLILHPHPLHGGSMNNKVVTTLARAFCDVEMPALTFNFPGVGKSMGVHRSGTGEIQDARRAIQVIKERFPNALLSVAGFSFGASIAYLLAPLYSFEKMVLIAPPASYVSMQHAEEMLPSCLVVQGEVDEVIEAQAVYDWIEHYAPSVELVRFPETGHYFHGKLGELREAVVRFLRK